MLISVMLIKQKHVTLNHDKTIKDIHEVIHVFGPLLQLWDIMEEEKEAAFQELSENNGDCSPSISRVFSY